MAYGFKRTILAVFIAVTVVVTASSCSDRGGETDMGVNEELTPTVTAGSEQFNDNKLIDNSSGVESDIVYKVTYYTVDTKALKLVQSVSAVKGGASLEPVKVLGLVSDSLRDSSIVIGFDDAYYDENGYCVIEFNDSIKDISLKDHNLETLILDACGQSILDNFESKGVIVRIGKGAYVTDQYDLEMDYVYISDMDD
ncbi:MAG: hypothetical protein K6F93_08660 [Lachnospiraceae bacterium]|nr:hypothetical protein [Lachnospiraceae bacterium]